MKKKDYFVIYFLLILDLVILINSKNIMNNIFYTSKLFIKNIFPSMFPTMIIANMLINLKIEKIIPKFIKLFFKKMFNLNEKLTSIYILSMLSGSPTNALLLKDYENDKNIELILATTSFLNPLFIIGGVGIKVFNSAKVGFILLILLYIYSFIKLYFNRNKITYTYYLKEDKNNNSFFNNFKESVNKSISTCLNIFAIILVFNVLIFLIIKIFNINYSLNIILSSLIEITSGIIKIKNLNIDFIYKFIISFVLLNFQGICLQSQTIFLIKNKKIRYFKYLIYKL